MKQQTCESAFIFVNVLYLFFGISNEVCSEFQRILYEFLITPHYYYYFFNTACGHRGFGVRHFLDVMNESLFPGILHPRL